MLGLYFHIPFCSYLCHYCDFPKTANYDQSDVERYFRALRDHARAWFQSFQVDYASVGTLYFGGGTPGLFVDEYRELMDMLRVYLRPGAEVTLEANPADITTESTAAWREIGFNRLSLGIQSFDARGLQALTRRHSVLQASAALMRAREVFANVNVDLIFGWDGQSGRAWDHDVARAVELGATHLSVYCLTVHGDTPLGRRVAREGATSGDSEAREADRWMAAREALARMGFNHEETSNWALPGLDARHNAIYWRGGRYIGIGAGAHGYVGDSVIGTRYAYPDRLRDFHRVDANVVAGLSAANLETGLSDAGLVVDARDVDDWLVERVWTGSRIQSGFSTREIESVTGRPFRPNARVERGIQEGLVIARDDRVALRDDEWFRGDGWARDLIASFGVDS